MPDSLMWMRTARTKSRHRPPRKPSVSQRAFQISSRLGSSKRIFIRARPIDHRQRNIEKPQIHRQLAAVVIPVIHHDAPREANAGKAHQLPLTPQQTPVRACPVVSHALQTLLRIADALIESRVDFLHALRLRRHEVPLAHIETVLLEYARHAPRNTRNVRGQLPQRHRLRMWLPRELLLRNSLEHSLGRSNFLAKLIQHRISNRSHSSSSPKKAVSKFQRFRTF